ncbi:DUF2799 domain-containing protein [Microbulbifer sp.]|uniref:DUF2799 domain-containing protein n=1 Tax=Microbulbifer sp. TaxID=1908541 RepID=UPI003F3E4916
MKNLSLRLLFLLPALLAGCAVVSENECRSGLWYERGLQDGARGRSQGLVYQIAQKCQEYGERVDSEAWLRGHEEGVEQYCTPENGYYQGRRGNSYGGVCTGPTADLFMAEYQRGLAAYQIELEYRRLLDRYESTERDLYSVRVALAETKDKDQIHRLKHRRRALVRELRRLDFELNRFTGFGFGLMY